MALRRSADLSRMVVEAEMRKIGIAPKKAKLHQSQIKVLKKAQDPKINTIVLYGGTGSGMYCIVMKHRDHPSFGGGRGVPIADACQC